MTLFDVNSQGKIMRMWMIDPRLMCDRHLLVEHRGLHTLRHSFVQRHKTSNLILSGYVDHTKLKERHDILALEILSRGLKHDSKFDMPKIAYVKEVPCVCIEKNLRDLSSLCAECALRIGEGVQ